MAPPEGRAARRWLYGGEGRIRAGWRVLLYLLMVAVLSVIGAFAVSVLPRDPVGWAMYLVLTVAAVLAGWVMLIRFDGRPPGALGLALTRHTPREIAVGYLIGALLIGGASLLLFVTGSARFHAEPGTLGGYLGTLAWTLAYFTLAAAFEEVLFRGYAFQVLVEAVGAWPTVLVTSALFSLIHLGNPGINAFALANIFLAGILLGFAYLRTRSLWFATTLHAGWNWTMASAIGFPVSGLVLADTPLYDAVETGADWWTGGGFGPEAGLAGTLVLLAGTAWLVRTRALREPPEVRALRPLVDGRLSEEAA